MNIINLKDVKAIEDTCGLIKELIHSDKLSVSYAIITGKAKSHMHKVMEEVYFVVKGSGRLVVGDDSYNLKQGDCVAIPKNTYHHLEKGSEDLEVVVVTNPKYDASDVIEEV